MNYFLKSLLVRNLVGKTVDILVGRHIGNSFLVQSNYIGKHLEQNFGM